MDVLTPDQRHENMSHIKNQNTKTEVLLRKALWHKGIRYRKNYKFLIGKPDITLIKYKIAIFCDGDFWHGRGYQHPGEQVKTNKKFWMHKLGENVARDAEVNEILTEQGWLVLRFWESDIKKNLNKCVKTVFDYIPIKKQ